jgi:2-dehydropantoate 2-reductase
MKIGIIGAGAIGGYYGAKLARAGESVHFIARGATLQALRSSGPNLISCLRHEGARGCRVLTA